MGPKTALRVKRLEIREKRSSLPSSGKKNEAAALTLQTFRPTAGYPENLMPEEAEILWNPSSPDPK